MNFNVNVIIDFSKDVKDFLSGLFGAKADVTEITKAVSVATEEALKADKGKLKQVDTPTPKPKATPKTETKPKAAAKKAEPTFPTMAEMRKAAKAYGAEHGNEAFREVLADNGYKKLSDIAEEDRQLFLDELEA